MSFGHGFWIVVWYGILLLGLVGLWVSLAWGGRPFHWERLDELLRAVGTILVSTGMLLLLYGAWPQVATGLLGLALGVFVAAFVSVRHLPLEGSGEELSEDSDTHPAFVEQNVRPLPPIGAASHRLN